MKKIGIVCCSNGLSESAQAMLEQLRITLEEFDILPVYSKHIFASENVRSGTGKERAEALMHFYMENEVEAVFDISGGDIANEILPYLDYSRLGDSDIPFYGYSDLTTVLNAIYTKTGKECGLYQLRNVVKPRVEDDNKIVWKSRYPQLDWLVGYMEAYGKSRGETILLREKSKNRNYPLLDIQYRFLQGEQMEGVMVGGNIRCFLKLAGTEYFPDLQGKILVLESLGGYKAQMITYLSQLSQMGAFRKVNGIMLGTFTKLEEMGFKGFMEEEVLKHAGSLPVAKTEEIGHGADAKCCMIGRNYHFYSSIR